jgi:enoyl-CoA hydratase/carnithine racemase
MNTEHPADAVLTERAGSVFRITINKPERRNAINATVVAGIAEGIRTAQATAGVGAIVLTGAGERAFCAGGDLSPTADGAPFAVDPAHPRHDVAELFKQMEACDLPIVARVNGHALAGGLGLLCACDLAVAADHATFGTPEVKIGLFPMMILPQMLRVLPLRRLMELCMTGDAIPAHEAKAIGLVNEVVPAAELDAGTDALVARLLRASPTALRLGKQAFHAMRDMSLRAGWDYAQLMLPMMARTEDAREGLRAFQDKRPPIWTGR